MMAFIVNSSNPSVLQGKKQSTRAHPRRTNERASEGERGGGEREGGGRFTLDHSDGGGLQIETMVGECGLGYDAMKRCFTVLNKCYSGTAPPGRKERRK